MNPKTWDEIIAKVTRETETARQVRIIAEGLREKAREYDEDLSDLLTLQALARKARG